MKDVINSCPECTELDRRDFARIVAVGSAALAVGAPLAFPTTAKAIERGPMPRIVNTVAEDLVKELYAGLSDDQKKAVVKPWNHAARQAVNPNRALDKKIGAVFTKPQQDLVQKIAKSIAGGDAGWHQISRAGTWDASKTFEDCGADIFGDPNTNKFAFLFTGHHLTIRCDGDSDEGVAFGGPIYYGHTPDPYSDRNVFLSHTKAVMKLYDALDPKQQVKAKAKLGDKKPQEGKASLDRLKNERVGIMYSDLSGDQKELVTQVMKAILSPFRPQDGDEVVRIIQTTGGLDKVHFAFYDEEYEGSSTSEKKPFSFWRLLGPGLVWNFRVLPHVHTFVNITAKV